MSNKMSEQRPIVSWKTSANGSLTIDADGDEKTDYSRWRLLDDRGRQTWHYLQSDEENETWPQSVADRYNLGLPTVFFQQLWTDA
jgi:lanosterol synthase